MSEFIYKHVPSGADATGNPVEAPTLVQREEIVRCGDCTYYDDEPDLTSSTPKCWRDPEHNGTAVWTRPDGFCAWGERRDDV